MGHDESRTYPPSPPTEAQALHESEQGYRALFEQTAVGMACVGIDGRLIDANPRLCRMLGYSLEKRCLCRDDQPVWGRVSSSLIRSNHGHPLYRMSVVEDLTDRKRAERRAAMEHAVSWVLARSLSA